MCEVKTAQRQSLNRRPDVGAVGAGMAWFRPWDRKLADLLAPFNVTVTFAS